MTKYGQAKVDFNFLMELQNALAIGNAVFDTGKSAKRSGGKIFSIPLSKNLELGKSNLSLSCGEGNVAWHWPKGPIIENM